jgi:hypothetical protein
VYSLAQQGSPTISLQDEDGKVRARLGLAAEGSPILRLLNKDGELRAIMGLTAEGTPVLQFLDKDGESLWTAPGTLPGGKAGGAGADDTASSSPEGSANP